MKKRSYGLICTALLMTGAQMPAVSGAAERFGIDMNAEKQAAQNDVLRDFWARRGGYAAAHCEECMQKYGTD